MYAISDMGRYFLVEVQGELNYDLIIEILKDEMSRPEYPDRNDLWDLSRASLLLQFEHLGRIWDVVMAHYPTQATRQRSAIVAQAGLNSSYAEMWASSRPSPCPFQVRTFQEVGPALAWLESDR